MHIRRQCVILPTMRYIAKALHYLFISRNVTRLFTKIIAKITRYLQSFRVIIIIFLQTLYVILRKFDVILLIGYCNNNCLEYKKFTIVLKIGDQRTL